MEGAGAHAVRCSRGAARRPGESRSPTAALRILRRARTARGCADRADRGEDPMADHSPPRTSLLLSPEALFRYQIVSAVTARALSGQGMDAAVRAVAAQIHRTPAGESTTVSVRSVYRWLAEDDRDEPAGPEPAPPAPLISLALPPPPPHLL